MLARTYVITCSSDIHRSTFFSARTASVGPALRSHFRQNGWKFQENIFHIIRKWPTFKNSGDVKISTNIAKKNFDEIWKLFARQIWPIFCLFDIVTKNKTNRLRFPYFFLLLSRLSMMKVSWYFLILKLTVHIFSSILKFSSSPNLLEYFIIDISCMIYKKIKYIELVNITLGHIFRATFFWATFFFVTENLQVQFFVTPPNFVTKKNYILV